MKILTKKYDESKRQEYLDKKQTEEEETRRAHEVKWKQKQEYLDKKQTEEEETRRANEVRRKQKQEYLDRKQESGEDTKEYYAAKEQLWLQAYAPNKRNLVEFKDEMLKRLYNEELKETCLFFMPKEPKQKREIKAVLDRQLSPDRHELKTTYINAGNKE